MIFKQKLRRLIIWISVIALGAAALYVIHSNWPQENKLEYLPTESILKIQIQDDIKSDIQNALTNIMDKNDFEVAVHVNLNQDEISEEQIKYEPKEISTSSLEQNKTPIPQVNALPGLIDNPFHNESLPGFPSYFDQFDIEKDDYLTRGLFSKILSTAYQLPKEANVEGVQTEIIDNKETEFSESVSTIVNEDILKLYRSGEFRPNDFLSKASLITALVRINFPTSNFYSQDVVSSLPYKDIPRNHWAYNYIKVALENKLIEEDILFNPKEKVTVKTALDLIEKTPLRSDIFNYYKFPKKDNEELFRTDNKKELTESNYYYNQEKTFFKSPSTKVKNVSIRVLVNELVFDDVVTIANIEDIVQSVVELNEERNDSLIIKSYQFTRLPLLVKIYRWKHWTSIYLLILTVIIGYFSNRLYDRYKKYKRNQDKLLSLKKEKEEKLAKIFEEQEEKTYLKIKKEIIDEASKRTNDFALKLQKWLEMLQKNPQYEEKMEETYEKIAIVTLFVDFEKPGLSTAVIKLFAQEHVRDTINAIEEISKIDHTKTRVNLLEFHENFMQPETLVGGKTTSNYIIDSAFDEKEKRSIFNIDEEEPFSFVELVNENKIKEFLTNENEVVAAFLLNKLSEERMLEISESLPSAKIQSIAKHLITVKNNPCELMDEFEERLKDKLFIGETSEASKNLLQLQKASTVFETLPKDVRTSIFDNLQESDPATLEKLQSEMFIFEDLMLLTDVDVQSLVFEIKDMPLLATALNKSTNELVNRFKENFSERFATQFNNAQQNLGEIEDEAIDKAQYEIIRTLRKLEKNDQISNLKQLKRSSQ